MIRIIRDDIRDQFSFLLEVFILKNEGVIAVLQKITFMAPFCSPSVGHYISLYMKSLAQKRTGKICVS